MQPFPSSVDKSFAILHGFSLDTLRVLVDLAPQLSAKESSDLSSSHPASAIPNGEKAQVCYRLRFEMAEKRYSLMKGLWNASLATQKRMEGDLTALHMVESISRMGLEHDCSAVLRSMRQAVGEKSVLDEMAALTGRLEATEKQSQTLIHMNRELRSCVALKDADEVPVVTPSDVTVALLTAEVETLRKHVIALELECARLQSDSNRFEQDERLRECEDVFDVMLGRERQDYIDSVTGESSSGLGAVLSRYHPVATCQNRACVAYAKRLRGGFQVAVSNAYARERAVRINGFIRQWAEPLETLRAQKDFELRVLRERICRFEQSTRMTSEEADMVELRAVSIQILDKASELANLKADCAQLEREYTRRRGVVAKLVTEENDLKDALEDARHEIQALTEERQLTISVTNDFRVEYAKLEKLRAEITLFQSGKVAEEFYKQKQDAANLTIEIENLRIERDQAKAGEEPDEVVLGVFGGPSSSSRVAAAGVVPSGVLATVGESGGGKRAKKSHGPDIFPAPDGTVILKCRCGDFVPIKAFGAHVQTKHSNQSKHPLLCSAGCGIFVVNRPMSDLEKHRLSGECAQRVAAIRRLMGAGC
jgi:hypothetical protein